MGAGAKHPFAFVDRLHAGLVHLHHGATHDVPACWFGVDRSTVPRAVGERPTLVRRVQVHGRPRCPAANAG
ncbi:transposase family protein [Streptomyces sp. NBC_01077]|uniref:transposase family protein n=1 Tax=Streptomyces sp. NBC_01077 TaxID=2903746 RepID=UPI0038692923|nr:transposase family protein [Streptomyces sp. NBC_01077]WSV44350.1 transposase family protein [Streptomyces sp. NBC_01077]